MLWNVRRAGMAWAVRAGRGTRAWLVWSFSEAGIPRPRNPRTDDRPDAAGMACRGVSRKEGHMKGLGRGPLFVLLGGLCFSTTGTVQALAPEGATPFVIGTLRMLLGGLSLLAWCLVKEPFPRFWTWPLRCLIPSTLALIGFQLFFFRGVALAGVAVGTVVAIGFSPLAVAVLGWFFLKEKPAWMWYPATAVALAGLVLLNLRGADGPGLAALAFPLAAGFSYACYFVFSKPLAQIASPVSVMTVLCLLSGLCLSPMLVIYPTAWIATPVGALVALHLGVVTTAMAFSLTLAGLKITPASTASTLSLAEPLSAACLGIFFLHEPVSLASCTGILLIFGSVIALVAAPGKNG